MKYLLIILVSTLLLSCTSRVSIEDPSGSRIVDVEGRGGEKSRGVILETGRVMTVRHGISACIDRMIGSGTYEARGCSITHHGQSYTIDRIMLPDMSRDIALLEYIDKGRYPSLRQSSELSIGQGIYVLTSSGILSGQIISLTPSYIAYDRYLSGSVFSGDLMTDIVVERGESGTPIWTLSGELIGVVSAVDPIRQRSYGVRE